MTTTETIQAIKAEIERLKGIGGIVPLDNREQKTGYESALIDIEIFLDSLESEKPVPNDLEEAAEEYAKTTFKKPYSDNPDEEVTIVEPDKYAGFIAGAKWQKQHDAELIEIAYNDGITIGMTKQKEQMMKEAVKWLVDDDYHEGECVFYEQKEYYGG